MSLLLNEDFTTYNLRLSYLTHIHDGVGERLINLPTSVLNNPAFRAAGWTPDTQAVKRCYSPPIPTTGNAGAGEGYFRAPAHVRGISLEDGSRRVEDGAGGMITGHQGSEDTIPAGTLGANERRRRQRTRKEMVEEDDSSDLESEESDEEDKTAAQEIKFAKMLVRDRSKSTPLPLDERDPEGPELMVTSPSRPPEMVGQGLRRGSLGQVEAIKQRARRDTTTSSEMSSENELDPNAFSRKLPGRPGGRRRVVLTERIQEEEGDHWREREIGDDADPDAVDLEGADSDLDDSNLGDASDLSDEFEVDAGTADSPSLLGMGAGIVGASDDTSPLKRPPEVPPAIRPQVNNSPTRKAAEKENEGLKPLPKLPPGRPMSTVQPHSLITMALKGDSGGAGGEKAFQRFADLSGKGESNPLWIKIYAPFSQTPTKPIELPLRRLKDSTPVTVSELIGLALWRYNEEEYQPPVFSEEDSNINRWTLRIIEDEEVDFDFPALTRTRPVTDFTSNNNRPPQRRARDKPWDEFGLVRATDEQFKENEELTPSIGTAMTPNTTSTAMPTPRIEADNQLRPAPTQRTDSEATMQSTRTGFNPARNPITGPSFASPAMRKETGGTAALDLPQRDEAQSTPRTGAPKTVTLQFTDPQSFATTNLSIPTTADTYIAELFDHGCKKLNLDKGLYVLKVHGTQTVAPTDRTVEALGGKLHLDLVRRRFIGAGDGIFGLGLSGSPGSSSPNAPLELHTITTPPAGTSKKKYNKGNHFNINSSTLNLGLGLGIAEEGIGKRYNVLRKQPLSFAPSHPRTLVITPEYLQILPAAPDSLAAPSGKVTNVPMASIIGVKALNVVNVWLLGS
ncbi:Component of a membrane-bound complex containing the Tor2p kinase [Vermiconidia calcicola]|uniref:Component of a membrane-bound complex containing the Tor2p kinase n=1 Tax=Vermiconidia calcicola TaxID=1690605 RepID=A0ACC3MD55_9PEZI|nr:Component of a membrane-bound complex containing the Tor2p kinase [Vermiconidia calcicola]